MSHQLNIGDQLYYYYGDEGNEIEPRIVTIDKVTAKIAYAGR